MAVGATTGLATPAARVTPLPLRERLRRPEYWQWVRFAVFGRAVPAMLFGFMAWLQIGHLQTNIAGFKDDPTAGVMLRSVLPNALYLAFCSIPVAIYLTRPMPRARDGRVVARAAAFTGTLMQLAVGAFLPTGRQLLDSPLWLRDLSAPVAICAFGFAVVGLAYLRRNLSIIPEARRLTTSGPYRLVRHPLYFAEILAAIALVVASPKLVPTAALLVFIAMQNLRAHFEEGLLRRVFPEYTAYARRTRRLIPFVC
jgi:protein-S-isoprenylcysteine O-methyltransferase Ste14